MNSLRLFWGLVVLSLGGLLIAVSEGYLDASIWESLWLIWPVILVVIGLRFLIKNDKLLMGVTLLVFLASALFVASDYRADSTVPLSFARESQSANYDIAAVKNVDVVVVTGATRLRLGALPEGTPAGTLYKINSAQMGRVSVIKSIDGDTVKLLIQETGQGYQMGPGMMRGRELEVLLPAELLLSLRVEGGATKLDIDLSNLETTGVELAIGASNSDIILGTNSASQTFKIEAGASNMRFLVPDGVGIDAMTEGGLSNVTSDAELEMVKSEDRYTTKDFATSATQVQMTVSSGLANIKFIRK